MSKRKTDKSRTPRMVPCRECCGQGRGDFSLVCHRCYGRKYIMK